MSPWKDSWGFEWMYSLAMSDHKLRASLNKMTRMVFPTASWLAAYHGVSGIENVNPIEKHPSSRSETDQLESSKKKVTGLPVFGRVSMSLKLFILLPISLWFIARAWPTTTQPSK